MKKRVWILLSLALLTLLCRPEVAMSDQTSLDRPEIAARLFHPRKDPAPADARYDAMATAPDGTRLAMRQFLTDASRPTLLLFHGNGEVASDYDDLAPLLARAGLNLVVGEFRGYGKSEGTPRAGALAGDAGALLTFLKKQLAATGYSPVLIVMGRSLGSACALSLATTRPDDFDALVVESGFAATLPLLRTLGVDAKALGLSETDGFNNLEHAAHYAKPTLFIHGGADDLIPVADARLLFAASPAKDKTLCVIPGAGHNDLFAVGANEYVNALASLVGRLPRP
jgi:alpha-beta hydrolase superfamily lysophospholipase